jgi:hypothetical protein
MMNPDSLHLRYDEGADVLYVMTPRYGPAYGEEDGPGLVWRYLDADHSLVGLTILDYEAYWRPRLDELVAMMADRFQIPASAARKALEQGPHKKSA